MKILFVLVLLGWSQNSPTATRIAAYEKLPDCQAQADKINASLDQDRGGPAKNPSGRVIKPAQCIPANQ